jgi:hypothetical protein
MGALIGHHSNLAERALGIWQVARPLRVGWWEQRKRERRCRQELGHCWHPDGYVDWWCCECSADTDGMPLRRCGHCAARPELARLV